MRKIIILGLFVLAGSRIFAEPELKGTAPELAQYLAGVPKGVGIRGEGEVRASADRAIVSLKVTTESRSLQEAVQANQDIRSKMLGYFKKQGIPAERVHASKFSSTPKFGLFSEKAKSYRVENVVKVTVLDEKEFQGAAGAVDTWSQVQFVGAEFEHADKEALKRKAVEQACDKANERKKIYEEKLGVKLVPAAFVEGMVVPSARVVGGQAGTPPSFAGRRRMVALSAGLPEAAAVAD